MNEILLGAGSLVGLVVSAFVSLRMLNVNRSAAMATTIGTLAESIKKLSDELDEERERRRKESAEKDATISDMQRQIDGLIKTNKALKKALNNGNGNGAK